jgi:hypothetical protein
MKRKDIVVKLMKEGLSEKILALMSDKQLNMLAERLLSEQIPPLNTGTQNALVKVPLKSIIANTDQVKKLASANIPFSANETKEVKEELSEPKLGEEPKKDYNEKEAVTKRCNAKIKQAIKDKKGYEDYTKAIKKLHGGKLPASTENLIKGKKEMALAESPQASQPLQEWVEKTVEKNYHPFTSKGEIIELIHSKLAEQKEMKSDTEIETLPDFLMGDAIMNAQPQTAEPTTKPTTKPGTKPTTRPTPKTPFQPGPGPKHNPKAERKI